MGYHLSLPASQFELFDKAASRPTRWVRRWGSRSSDVLSFALCDQTTSHWSFLATLVHLSWGVVRVALTVVPHHFDITLNLHALLLT